MDESIVEFVKSVRIKSCRVINTPHLVFLCGGTTAVSGKTKILSARDYFYRYIKAHNSDLLKRIRLAEEINDWFDENTFTDLLELETYLADTCDLTILFVESAGSIAELGAFAAVDLLCARTLAVLNSKYKSARTFIADGPVRRIKKRDKDLIRYFEWNDIKLTDPSNNEIFEDMSKELIEFVLERTAPKERLLDAASDGHTMFLISDLVNLIGITNSTEILECLSMWGYSIDHEKLARYLSLLKHLGLIKPKPYSAQIYYLNESKIPLIRYSFVPGTKMRDRARIKLLLRAALFEKDERRMKVYRQENSRSSKEKPHV